MTGLHDAFTAWLAAGARDTLPRDVALHASACPECLGAVAAFDSLTAIDAGAASMPMAYPGRARTRLAVAPDGRALAALVAVVVVVGAGFIALNGVRPSSGPTALATETPREDVLGGVSSPAPSSSASPSSTPSDLPEPTDTASEAATSPSNPPMGGGPPPISTPRQTIAPSEPTPTARTTPSPAATPTTAPTAVPTPIPTPVPTPEPTPIPTVAPTPVPDDCADGIDNDGDLLIDEADPGCALDGNEASL